MTSDDNWIEVDAQTGIDVSDLICALVDVIADDNTVDQYSTVKICNGEISIRGISNDQRK